MLDRRISAWDILARALAAQQRCARLRFRVDRRGGRFAWRPSRSCR